VQVASDDRVQAVQAKSGLHGGDDVGRLKATVGVDDETPRRFFVDDPPPRPFVVFGGCDPTRKPQSRQARRSKLPPLLPALVVAGGVGEAIAVGFGFRQGRVVDHKHAAHPPEDSDAGPTASGACARHCAALTEPKDASYHIFPLGGHMQ